MTPVEQHRAASKSRYDEVMSDKKSALYLAYRERKTLENRACRLRAKFKSLVQRKAPSNIHLKYCSTCKERRQRRFFPKVGRYWGVTCAYCITGISDSEAVKVLTALELT